MSYHDSVLLKNSVDFLEVKEGGIYVDVTYGGGGHSREILSRAKNCSLYAFDQDEDALANQLSDDRLVLIHSNFSQLEQKLSLYRAIPVDGLLADLGVSGHQFDQGSRGFSIRMDEPLDMRMGKKIPISARDFLNDAQEEVIAGVLRENSDLNRVRTLANAIKYHAGQGRMNTTGDLVSAVKKFAEKGKENKLLSQVFQAIRMEVNQETAVLKELLSQSARILRPGGRLVVISYHSIEDRLVKNFMKSGNFEGEIRTNLFGVPQVPFDVLTRKPLVPSEQEISENNRARSAKLRVAVKK